MNCQPQTDVARLRAQLDRLGRACYQDSATIHFGRAILGMFASPLPCDICRDALPEQIEAELNNSPGPEYRQIRHHLDLCPECAKVYLELLETALLSEEGPLPRPSLTIDLSFLEASSARSSSDA